MVVVVVVVVVVVDVVVGGGGRCRRRRRRRVRICAYTIDIRLKYICEREYSKRHKPTDYYF